MFDPPWYRESEIEQLAFTMYVLEKEGLFDVDDESEEELNGVYTSN
jgi:hypothetical protein